MQLREQLDDVKDQESLLRFVHALVKDREEAVISEKKSPSSPYGPDAGGWENITIEQFLESAAAWAESTKFGETQGLSPTNPWKQFGVFLYCGKIYE